MTKANPTSKKPEENLLGENTVLTLRVPRDVVEREYQEILKHEAQKVTLKGFRQGKAPLDLAEAVIGRDKLMEHALNHTLPKFYEQAVVEAKIVPLVQPQITPKTGIGKGGEDWIFEAATAVAPQVRLGDFRKLIKAGAEKYTQKLKDSKDLKENDDERLQTIFVTLIETIKPKVAPLLLEEEMNQQLNQLDKQLRSRKIELADYIKSQNRTQDEFREDLAAVSLGALQLEFILQEITHALELRISDVEIKEWLKSQKYPEDTSLPEDLRHRLTASLLRKKTTEEILALAKVASTPKKA